MMSPHRPPRPSTSLDVARRAGVSRSTVSNILNGKDERFPEATRERVLTAAAELAYTPSLAGRSLVSGHSDTVVVLLPNTTFGSNLQDAVDEVVESTRQIGGNVVVRFASTDPEATVAALHALRPLAVVDFGVLSDDELSHLEALKTIVVPSARRDRSTEPDGGVSQVQATVLLERGPRQLWFAALSDERTDRYGPARLRALEDFCRSRGLPSPRQTSVPLDLEGASRALATILDGGGPAGVACYNDDVAIALLAAARESSIAVPDRLSVVGVDHTRVGQLWSPRLTTLDIDMHAVVGTIARDLRARLEGTRRDEDAEEEQRYALVRGETA